MVQLITYRGARKDLHVLQIAECVNCDVPLKSDSASCGVDLMTLSEYHINKHLTRIQAQATGHRQCESMNAQCIFVIQNCYDSVLISCLKGWKSLLHRINSLTKDFLYQGYNNQLK